VRAVSAASTAPGPTVAKFSDRPLATDELRAALGDPVLDPELLQRALTHRSFAY
jgi:ribonuclease III